MSLTLTLPLDVPVRPMDAKGLNGGYMHGVGKNTIFEIHFWEYKAPPFSFPLPILSYGPSKWKETVVASGGLLVQLRKLAPSSHILKILTGAPAYHPPFRG